MTGEGAKADTVIATMSHAVVGSGARGPWMSEREEQVARAAAALSLGRGVLVLGGAGVGKSHLADLAVRSIGATAVEAPRAAPPSTPLSTRRKAVSRSLGLATTAGSGADALALVRSWLPTAAPGGPAPLLRIEDAHLLDSATADAIATLARRGEIVLLATARPIAGSVSPWHELWRDDVVDRVDAGDLTLVEVQTMLAVELGRAASSDTARRLWVESGGNAFYLHELVADQVESGTLVDRDGVWVLTRDPEPGPQLLERARRELEDLTDPAMRALQAIVLLGPLRLGTLLDLVDRDVLEDLLVRGVVRTTAVGHPEIQVEMAHRLLGHAVRSTIPPTWRHALLRRAGSPLTDGPLSRATVMLMLTDGMRVAPAVLRAAVIGAREDGQPAEVVTIVDAAFGPAADPERTDSEVVALLHERARAQRDLGRSDAALADVEAALPHLRRAILLTPEEAELPQLALDIALLHADLLDHRYDDTERALAALAAGARWLAALPRPDSARLGVDLEVSRLTRLGRAGRHAEAQADAVRLLDEAPVPRVALALACPTGLGLLQAGRFDDAWRIVRRYRPLAATSDESHRETAAEVAVVGLLAHLWAGEIPSLDDLGVDADGRPTGFPWVGAPITRGLVAAASGAWSMARRELSAANLRLAEGAAVASAAYGRAAEALAAAASGEHRDARTILAGLERLPRGMTAVIAAELRLLRLDTQIWLRDASAARLARSLAEWATTAAMPRIEMESLHRSLVLDHRAGEPAGTARLARLRVLLSSVRSPRAAAVVHHAEALRTGDIDLIGIAERELNRRGLWLPPGARADVLTPREREIAALARARLTSRMIASRLGVSARTVDSHLASIFLKLGIRSREGLADALH